MRVSIQKIIDEMPTDLSDLEKARYLYLKIGDIITYNFLYHREIDRRLREDIYSEDITIHDLERDVYQNKITLVCKQASELLAEALNRVNIPSKIEGLDFVTQQHVDVISMVDGKRLCFNIMKDAMLIQKGFKTREFGLKNTSLLGTKCDTLTEEEIEEVDKKLDYIKYGMYMDDTVAMLRKEMLDEENLISFMKSQGKKDFSKDSITKYKLSFIYQFLNNSDKKLELMELRQYYLELFLSLFTPEERAKLSYYDYTDTKDYSINSSITVLDLENETCYYMYDAKEGMYKEVSPDVVKDITHHARFAYGTKEDELIKKLTRRPNDTSQELDK